MRKERGMSDQLVRHSCNSIGKRMMGMMGKSGGGKEAAAHVAV